MHMFRGYLRDNHCTDVLSTLYPVIYVVANPVHGILDRTISKEHLQSYSESTKTKTKTKNKGTITQSTCQKTVKEGHCKEVQRSTRHIMVTALYSNVFSSKLPN